jgi:hypothetical protein
MIKGSISGSNFITWRPVKSKNVYKSKRINSSQSNENDPEH